MMESIKIPFAGFIRLLTCCVLIGSVSTSVAAANGEVPIVTSDSLSGEAGEVVPMVTSDALSGTAGEAVPAVVSDALSGTAAQVVPAVVSDALSGTAAEAVPAVVSDALSGTAAEAVPAVVSDTLSGTAAEAVPTVMSEALLGAAPEVAPAGDDKAIEICEIHKIDTAFKAYEGNESREQITRIQVLLKVFGYDPGPRGIDGLLGTDTDGALVRLCQDYKVGEYLMDNEQSKNNPLKYLATHLISLLEMPGPIHLSGDGCGCSRDFSTTVYGFYPYLLSRGEEQIVDFSLFDRIGFNMQILDKEGDIQNRLQWKDDNDSGKNIAGFISNAHKHRVKVDLAFYLSDWQHWSDKTIDNAVKNIVETANQEFHGSDTNLWRKFFPLKIDGINLYFDNYIQSSKGSRLVDIVQNLVEELKGTGSAMKLNIMLGPDWPGISSEQLEGLKGVLADDNTVDNVFIFLTQNSSQSKKKLAQISTSKEKKKLRQIIENTFHGAERQKVLRKIVPIIKLDEIDFEPLPANDNGDSQFDDDLVYLKDNFAGVGLWPLPLKSRGDAVEIEEALIKHYQTNDGLNYLGEKLESYAPNLCKFVCPNRILFYIALGLLVGLLAIYMILALWSCRLREIYRRHFLYFIALFLLIALILILSLVCDPSWEKRVDRIVIGILVLAILGIAWRNIRKAVQPRLP